MSAIAINAMIMEEGRLSGIGHYIVQLITHFSVFSADQSKPDQILVFCRDTAAHHVPSLPGIKVVPLAVKPGRIARVVAEQLVLPKLLRKHKADVLLNPAHTGPVWGTGVIVTSVHDLYYKVVPRLVPAAQRLYLSAFVPLCCRRSRRVIASSTSTKNDLTNHYPDLARKISVIPLANRFSRQSPRLDASSPLQHPPYVLLVAALTGNKNPEPLVAAMASLRRRHPKLTLIHVGSDPEQRLKRATDTFRAHDWITSRTGVADAELANLYEHCLCVAIPSLYEGFGLPLLEAQSFGAAVVSSNRGSLPEVGGDGALYVDPTDPVEFAAALEELISSPERRDALRRAGLSNEKRFSWERTARATWDILQEEIPSRIDQYEIA